MEPRPKRLKRRRTRMDMTRAAVEKVIASSGPAPLQGFVNRSVTMPIILAGMRSVQGLIHSKTALTGSTLSSKETMGSGMPSSQSS